MTVSVTARYGASTITGESLGSNTITVGNGGQYPTIKLAIEAIGRRYTARITDTKVLTATLNSTVVTFVGTAFRTGAAAERAYTGDFIKFGVVDRYYKIKSVDSDTQLTLFAAYKGTTISAASTLFSMSYLDRKQILLLPGIHTIARINNNADAAITIYPGIDICGISRYGCIISNDNSEGAGAAYCAFDGWSENTLENVSIGDDPLVRSTFPWVKEPAFGSTIEYGGAHSVFRNVTYNMGARGAGSDIWLTLPKLTDGVAEFVDCEFNIGSLGLQFGDGGTSDFPSPTKTNSIVEITNCKITRHTDWFYDSGSNIFPNGILANIAGTYNVNNTHIRIPDSTLTVGDDSCGILVNSAAAVNVNSCVIDVANTGDRAVGVSTTALAGATAITISNSKITATGTTPVGVIQASAGTTAIASSAITGSTNSVVRSAGTLNIEKGVDLIGPVSGTLSSTVRGVITLNGSTPVTVTTSKVHTASKIKLSRQAVAGTASFFGVGTITNNTSFTIVGVAGDTSTVVWELEE